MTLPYSLKNHDFDFGIEVEKSFVIKVSVDERKS
jgi:hypothetical protein